MDYSLCHLVPLNFESANTISNWKYDPPYSAYSFKGHSNEYLKRKENWGKEQFCMVLENEIIVQVACQQMDGEVWVGGRSIQRSALEEKGITLFCGVWKSCKKY
jgi:hypothetical protein